MLRPSESIEDYVAYTLVPMKNAEDLHPITFETSNLTRKFGIVKCVGNQDAMVYKLKTSNSFEVYIFEKMYASRILLLQMLINGQFDAEISRMQQEQVYGWILNRSIELY